MSQVIIGMGPHGRSATVEVMTSDETVVGRGRYGTDAAGHRAMLAKAYYDRKVAAGKTPREAMRALKRRLPTSPATR